MSQPRKIRPDDFEIFDQIPGIVGIARDEQLRMFWGTKAFYRIVGYAESSHELMGKTLYDVIPKSVAQERSKIMQGVIDTGKITHNYQFNDDLRVVTTLFPLDEDAFGHKGVLAIIKDAPIDVRTNPEQIIPVLATPGLSELNILTPRELEVLHHIACSLSTDEIAAALTRSRKTIDNHITAIHTKLNTHSRAQLVRYACERGIQSFSDEQWSLIVQGSKAIGKINLKLKGDPSHNSC